MNINPEHLIQLLSERIAALAIDRGNLDQNLRGILELCRVKEEAQPEARFDVMAK